MSDRPLTEQKARIALRNTARSVARQLRYLAIAGPPWRQLHTELAAELLDAARVDRAAVKAATERRRSTA